MTIDHHGFVTTVEQVAHIPEEEAERVACATLEALASRISAGEAEDIAERLPGERSCLEADGGAQRFHVDELLRRVADGAGIDREAADATRAPSSPHCGRRSGRTSSRTCDPSCRRTSTRFSTARSWTRRRRRGTLASRPRRSRSTSSSSASPTARTAAARVRSASTSSRARSRGSKASRRRRRSDTRAVLITLREALEPHQKEWADTLAQLPGEYRSLMRGVQPAMGGCPSPPRAWWRR